MTSPTQSAMEQQQRDNLHSRIMNLPCNVPSGYPYGSELCVGVYREGHRDARHAAAELAAEHASELRSLRDSLALAKADLERYRWLRDNFLGADFDYGGNDAEMRNGEQVLLIRHAGTPVWGSLDLTVDAALNKEQP